MIPDKLAGAVILGIPLIVVVWDRCGGGSGRYSGSPSR